MSSQLLPIHQWPHGNACAWAHGVCQTVKKVIYVTKGIEYPSLFFFLNLYIHAKIHNVVMPVVHPIHVSQNDIIKR